MTRRRARTAALLMALIVGLTGGAQWWRATAQEGTQPTPPPAGPIQVFNSEPNLMIAGQGGSLSVFGANFTQESVVRLVGFSFLDTTFLNSGALRASVPENIPPGQYGVEVSGPNGMAISPVPLLIVAPTATPAPAPTPTTAPTPVPGQPVLVVRNFATDPTTVTPGGQVALTFEVVNQGNRTALGVAVTLDAEGRFIPAAGQAAVTLAELAPGASVSVTLRAVAARDTPSGPALVPVAFAFRDFERTYTSSATLSVVVERIAEVSQLTLSAYAVDPDPVIPGQSVTVAVTVTNTGNQIARQMLIRVAGADSVLLAGPQGDSFPLGDLAPGESITRELRLVVSRDAQPGPQPQPVTLSYLQDGEATDNAASMTVTVARVSVPAPVILLRSYTTGSDFLEPGDQFMLTITFVNVGNDAARNTLLTFGTVESSSPPSDGGSGGPGSPDSGSGSTTTTPSDVFAPIGAGATVYLGGLEPDGSRTVTQRFIVNGRTVSGLYSLPLTINYARSDGTASRDTLRVSLPVVAPPQLQIALQNPIPETVNIGEPLPIAVGIRNDGTARVNLTRATISAENAEVMEGAEARLEPLGNGEDITVSGMLVPSEEGPVTITFTLHFQDDLRQARTLESTFEAQAVTPPPPPEEVEPPPTPTPEPPPTTEELLRRLILGLLGLGS